MWKIEQMRKSLVNFLMAGDVQNLLDIWRIAVYREPAFCECCQDEVESEVKE